MPDPDPMASLKPYLSSSINRSRQPAPPITTGVNESMTAACRLRECAAAVPTAGALATLPSIPQAPLCQV
ncbi:hypothetical protein KBAHV46_01770 [Aeromonas hydrophila]|nr:hypothetical protein KBAHV42_01760 [Aeromonas hydrophila]CAD7502855.1 hypothetical protein KBAHV46_01770 [Aeromonas hydrophila]CAD7504468.1 hypothetical protein KBAHV22_01770 [Aeromonas hydrophila]